jgi:uncharacterized protein with PQ loop repeat
VLVLTLSVLTVVFTTLRSWPQFVRIVVRHEQDGVSVTTWSLALANHTGWFAYGVLAGLPVFVVVNLLAAFGCAGTVWVLRSPVRALAVAAATAALTLAAHAVDAAVVLAIITGISLSMFVPQAVRAVHRPAAGVSPASWATAALASALWLSYAWAIGRFSLVIADFFMLPLSLVILARTRGSGGRRQPALRTTRLS